MFQPVRLKQLQLPRSVDGSGVIHITELFHHGLLIVHVFEWQRVIKLVFFGVKIKVCC